MLTHALLRWSKAIKRNTALIITPAWWDMHERMEMQRNEAEVCSWAAIWDLLQSESKNFNHAFVCLALVYLWIRVCMFFITSAFMKLCCVCLPGFTSSIFNRKLMSNKPNQTRWRHITASKSQTIAFLGGCWH